MASQLVVPENLNTQSARLPAAYEAARSALANCASIDECNSWANKAQALASYARQADDETLEKQAVRIRSRAIRRCGELLQEFRSAGGRPAESRELEQENGSAETTDGTVISFPSSQKEAAEQAGMSERQMVTAVRVANIPTDLFDAQVESDRPPTVTALADMGRKAQERTVQTTKPAIVLMGFVRRLAEFTETNNPAAVASGVDDFNRREMRRYVAQCRRWLKEIAPNLRETHHGI